VLEVVFILLESLSPSRRIFIGSQSLPPSLVCRFGPSITPGSDHPPVLEPHMVLNLPLDESIDNTHI
jgi:hypothetical protein